MSKLLILGATGFIGSHLCLEAKRRKWDIIAGVRKESNLSFLIENKIPYFTFQLNQTDILQEQLIIFKTKHPQLDYIIYNIGCTQSLNKEDYYRINFQYLKNFIEELKSQNYFPNKLLFTSSLAVHSGIIDKKIDEKFPFSPLTHYGKSKVMAEQYLKTIDSFPIIISRPTAVYGPRDLNFLSLIQGIKRHLELYPANESQGLSFIYIHDLVQAYFEILEQKSLHGAFILSDGKDYTAFQLNQIIKNTLGVKTIRARVPLTVLKGMAYLSESMDRLRGKAGIFNRDKVKELTVDSWHCDNNKLINNTGFQPEYDLEKGMKETLQWYKKHGYI